MTEPTLADLAYRAIAAAAMRRDATDALYDAACDAATKAEEEFHAALEKLGLTKPLREALAREAIL
jgi:hypothetical protein